MPMTNPLGCIPSHELFFCRRERKEKATTWPTGKAGTNHSQTTWAKTEETRMVWCVPRKMEQGLFWARVRLFCNPNRRAMGWATPVGGGRLMKRQTPRQALFCHHSLVNPTTGTGGFMMAGRSFPMAAVSLPPQRKLFQIEQCHSGWQLHSFLS